MNHQSTDSSISSRAGASAEAISHRAYEIWESEGRPEGCDLRHWLQAEQELSASRPKNKVTEPSGRAETAQRPAVASRSASTSSAASTPSRDAKRASSTPFSGEKNGTSSVSSPNVAKRKPTSAPVL